MLEIYEYPLSIVCKTGMHIGGGKTFGIGNVDNVVVKDVLTGYPYIPGSSIKGRCRFCLEVEAGRPGVCDCGTCDICKLFGCGDIRKSQSITRLLFSDAFLDEKTKEIFDSYLKKGDQFREIKYETAIDRRRGNAKGGSLRMTERVPAGTVFEGNIRMIVLKGDSKDSFEKTLRHALKLVEATAIGSSGSRGYGWVEVRLGEGKKLL